MSLVRSHFQIHGDMMENDDTKIQRLFDEMEWRFAKTMPQIPHSYTRRGDWESEETFEWAVRYIKENSKEGKFFNRTYEYLYLGDFKYWVAVNEYQTIILINRAKRD